MSQSKIVYSACKEFKITAEIVERFAGLVGDYNPVHLSEQAASRTRFGRRIAHGMIGMSYAQSLFPIDYTYSCLSIKFKKPIYLEDTIHINLQLSQPQNLQIQITKNTNNQNSPQLVTEASGKWHIVQNKLGVL